MCVVSMVIDHSLDKWKHRDWWHQIPPASIPAPILPQPSKPELDLSKPKPIQAQAPKLDLSKQKISREEFDELKKEVQDLKELIARAKEYDRKNNEPDCEMDEKVQLVKSVAKLVGVDVVDVLGRA